MGVLDGFPRSLDHIAERVDRFAYCNMAKWYYRLYVAGVMVSKVKGRVMYRLRAEQDARTFSMTKHVFIDSKSGILTNRKLSFPTLLADPDHPGNTARRQPDSQPGQPHLQSAPTRPALSRRTRVRPAQRPLADPPAHHAQSQRNRRHRPRGACPHPF